MATKTLKSEKTKFCQTNPISPQSLQRRNSHSKPFELALTQRINGAFSPEQPNFLASLPKPSTQSHFRPSTRQRSQFNSIWFSMV